MAQPKGNNDDRKTLLTNLKNSQKELLSTVKGLTTEQLNFKPSPDAWSIAECVEHIAITEESIFGMVGMGMKENADPSRRGEVKMTDEQITGLITSREQKVKTREAFEPSNSFGSYEEALAAFNERRKSNMKYAQTTQDDLRNHYAEFPFGVVDSYQVILFMSGHTVRHTAQIKEVMADANFPK